MTRPPRELEERGQFPKRTRKRRRPSISKYLSVSNVKGLVSKALVVLLVAYVGVTVYHLSNGFDLPSAVVGGTRDARVLASCWRDMGVVKTFVERPAVWGKDPAVLDLPDCRTPWGDP